MDTLVMSGRDRLSNHQYITPNRWLFPRFHQTQWVSHCTSVGRPLYSHQGLFSPSREKKGDDSTVRCEVNTDEESDVGSSSYCLLSLLVGRDLSCGSTHTLLFTFSSESTMNGDSTITTQTVMTSYYDGQDWLCRGLKDGSLSFKLREWSTTDP